MHCVVTLTYMASIQNLLPQALQSLYVCTGCDYVSFFVGMGKASFFYQHSPSMQHLLQGAWMCQEALEMLA